MTQTIHPRAPEMLGDTSPSTSPSQKLELVQRVIKSETFSSSRALRAFLVYITDHEIKGEADKLKEQAIGAEALGRKPNYDPTDDNIVRVRAHELRSRLERFFETEGQAEPIVITIPKGGYVPEFLPRPAAGSLGRPTAEEHPSEETALPQTALPEASATHTRTAWRPWLPIAAVFLVVIAGTAAITRYIVKSQLSSSSVKTPVPIRDFWGQFFDKPGEELKVVYADTSFALWQDLNGKTLDLGDYLNRKYYDAQGNRVFNVVMRRVTTPADMALSVHLAALAAGFGGQELPEFARDADAQFFHDDNIVLIGSHRSNPWVAIYEPSLNFFLDQDPKSGAPEYRNRSPRGQEPATFGIPAMYDTQKTEEKTYPSYGVVALLKGCGNRGLTVLAEGLNTQGTQAAGDLIEDPERLDMLLRSIGHTPGTRVVPFEALFQITSVPGGYDTPRIIAYRLRPPEACVGG